MNFIDAARFAAAGSLFALALAAPASARAQEDAGAPDAPAPPSAAPITPFAPVIPLPPEQAPPAEGEPDEPAPPKKRPRKKKRPAAPAPPPAQPWGMGADPSAPPAPIEVRGPSTVRYKEGDPIPFGYHLERHANLPLILTGSFLLASFYHASVVLGLGAGAFDTGGPFGDDRGKAARWAFVPVAGPFIYAATEERHNDAARGFATAFGIGQVAGAVMLLGGIAHRPSKLYRDDAGPSRVGYEPGDPVPWNYRVETRSRRGLVSFGVTAFGAAYFATLTSGMFIDCSPSALGCTVEDDRGLFAVPVFGSFYAASRGYLPDALQASAVLLGALQTGGLAALIAGLVDDELVLVRDRTRKVRMLRLSPALGPQGFGLGLAGSF